MMDYSISRPVENADLRVISLGAGVQSTVMALMASRGDIGPMPHAAIFADTGWEPVEIYEHLDWLESELKFPVYQVSGGNIKEAIQLAMVGEEKRFSSVPWYTKDGIGRRQCTREFKITPIQNEVRRLLGYEKGERITGKIAEQWIGISIDEMQRLKNSRVKWIQHRWPLIEMRMNRVQCQLWFADNYPGRKLAKSACLGCPFHSDQYWSEMKNNRPDEWAEVVDIDKSLRAAGPLRGMRELQYMHRSAIALEDVDFDWWSHQQNFGFLEECEGMCGI